jgi:hypothetical protein
MKHHKHLSLIVLILYLLAIPCCYSDAEKDVIGGWKLDSTDPVYKGADCEKYKCYIEFFEDETFGGTWGGGRWSILSDGRIKLMYSDGTIETTNMKKKDNKKIIEIYYGIGGSHPLTFIKQGK